MPIYEYQCSKCSHRFEMIHGVDDKDLKIICPQCRDTQPQKLISSFSCGSLKGTETAPVSGCGPRNSRFS